jgi:hypothetical protein
MKEIYLSCHGSTKIQWLHNLARRVLSDLQQETLLANDKI